MGTPFKSVLDPADVAKRRAELFGTDILPEGTKNGVDTTKRPDPLRDFFEPGHYPGYCGLGGTRLIRN